MTAERLTLTDEECDALTVKLFAGLPESERSCISLICLHVWRTLIRAAYARGLQRAAEIARKQGEGIRSANQAATETTNWQWAEAVCKRIAHDIDREREGRGGET